MTTANSRLGKIIITDGDHATLEFQRFLPHPPEVVWQAITEPDQLQKWYMTRAKIDGRTGGTIEFWSGPSQFHVTGKILTWDQPHVFEHEWNVEPRAELPNGEHSIVKWEIIPSGNGSVLRMIFNNLTKGTSLGFAPGSHAFLDRLEALLSRNPLPDWRKRVEELRDSYPSWNRPR